MTIIKIEADGSGQHRIEAQSGRTSCWLAGYIAVPPALEAAALASLGWCDLTIEDGTLVGITPRPRPKIEPVAPPPTEAEQLRADVDFLAAMTGVSL